MAQIYFILYKDSFISFQRCLSEAVDITLSLFMGGVIQYSGQKLSSVPHIFAIAEAAYQRLNNHNNGPQDVHFLGEC